MMFKINTNMIFKELDKYNVERILKSKSTIMFTLTYLCFFNQTSLKLSDTTIPAATIIMFSYFSHKPHGL